MCQPAFGRIPILLRAGWSPPSQAPKLRRTRQRTGTSVASKALVVDLSRAADPCEAQVGADAHNCPTIHPSRGRAGAAKPPRHQRRKADLSGLTLPLSIIMIVPMALLAAMIGVWLSAGD